MLNVGPAELIVILLVALLVVGPKRLPEVGRSVGRALREIRRQTDEVRSSFEATINADPDDDVPDEPRTTHLGAVEEWDGERPPPTGGELSSGGNGSAATPAEPVEDPEKDPRTSPTEPADPDPGIAGPS